MWEWEFGLSLGSCGSVPDDSILHYFNATKIYQFKAKESEIIDYTLCLGNFSKDFTNNNTKKTVLKGTVIFFVLDYQR